MIFIDFSRVPRDCDSYEQYVNRVQDGINQDLEEAYPEIGINVSGTVWNNLLTIFEKTKERFIFVIDEWDAVFHKTTKKPCDLELGPQGFRFIGER